jgi:Thioesterase-like superfamily
MCRMRLEVGEGGGSRGRKVFDTIVKCRLVMWPRNIEDLAVIELPGTPEEMLAFLELEHIDGDIYRGGIGFWPEDRPAIYGGQVAAQALRAAGHTVPEGRLPHSLHGYFLRRGDIEAPVIFKVDRDRDGRSFSARRVTAMQHGEVIWDMACSFAPPIEGAAEYTPEVNSQIASPDSCVLNQEDWCPLVEIRTAPHPDGRPVPMIVCGQKFVCLFPPIRCFMRVCWPLLPTLARDLVMSLDQESPCSDQVSISRFGSTAQ